MNKKFKEALFKIYNKPASVTVIEGAWKTGKTDFGLYLTEVLKHLGIIKIAGANIQIYNNLAERIPQQEQIEFINNFLKLKMWGFSNLKKKAYVFDEAIKNAPSREAMTKLNKEWLRIIPELSKMKTHLIVITQEGEYMESIFKNKTFRIATWKKSDLPKKNPLFRKVVTLNAKKYYTHKLKFFPIPKTNLCFDPYLGAIMTLEPESDTIEGLPPQVKMCFDFGEGNTTEDLKIKYALPTRKQAIREVRKGIRMLRSSCLVSPNLRWDKGEAEMTPNSKNNG